MGAHAFDRTLLHSKTWASMLPMSLSVIVRPAWMSSMENSCRCMLVFPGRKKNKI